MSVSRDLLYKLSNCEEVDHASKEENRQEDREEDNQKGAGQEDLCLRALWYGSGCFQGGNGRYSVNVLWRGHAAEEEIKRP
jgi:hypothetical protein